MKINDMILHHKEKKGRHKKIMSSTTIICFANNKGGSGKSTTCANVGYCLSLEGKKVLLLDADMQMNLTLSFFNEEKVLEMAKSEKNIYWAIKNQEELTSYIYKTPFENLDMIPSSTLMRSIEYKLFTKWQREFILKKCLEEIKASSQYDYILMDAPPTLGGWVMNLLCASDHLIIPVEASPWGLFGLANMFEFLDDVKKIVPQLNMLGVAVTKADTRKNYYKQTIETLQELSEVRVFESVIRVDSAIEWAQDNSMPVAYFKKASRSAKEYAQLAREVVKYGSR